MLDEIPERPVPLTDPVLRESVIAAFALAVYEARLEAEARLAGLMPPPSPSRAALRLMRRMRLRRGSAPRSSGAASEAA